MMIRLVPEWTQQRALPKAGCVETSVAWFSSWSQELDHQELDHQGSPLSYEAGKTVFFHVDTKGISRDLGNPEGSS